VVNKAGQAIPVIISGRPFFENGKFAGVLVALTDITQQKQAEEALARERDLLHALMDNIPDTIYFKDAAGRFTRVNAAQAQVLGVSDPESVVGKTDFDFFTSEHAQDAYADEQAIMKTGQPLIGKIEKIRRADGQFRWVSCTKSPIRDDANRPMGIVGVSRDITEWMQARESLRQYAAELAARNEELDAFAHTVAHDLKHTLSIIIGLGETLELDHAAMPAKELEEYLGKIAKNGRKMSNIVEELLLLSSVRQMEEIDVAPLDMAEIIAEVRARLADLITGYHAKIVLPGQWPVALGHAPWIEEVWINYISNAVKYGGRPPHLEIGATPQPDGTVRFWVHDNGSGLTPHEQAQLFAPFTRLGQIRARGYGLGLSIVRRIVEKLGGQVGVESQPGQGCVFSFTLPASRIQ
jgi:PAS domain S-box-containing protein